MAYFRISELAPGAVPNTGASLLEISMPDATTVSGYDSFRTTIDELFIDRTLGGIPLAPTAAAGTRTTQVANTEFVSVAVDYAMDFAAGAYLPLIGGTLTGPLYAPAVHVTDSYYFTDTRTGTEWALYADGGWACLWVPGAGDRFCVQENGDAWVARDCAVGNRLYVGSSVSSTLALFDDGSSHIEASNVLYINGNTGVGTVFGGQITVHGPIYADSSLRVSGIVEMNGVAYANSDLHVSASLFIGVGSNYLTLFDDGNSHIESQEQLWLNGNGRPTVVGGNLTVSGSGYIGNTLEVGSWLQVDGGRIVSKGGNSPSIAFVNSDGGGPYGLWNAANSLGLGRSDAAGNPVQEFAHWDANGYLTQHYPATVWWGGTGVALTVHTGGPDASINYDNSSGIYWVVGNMSGNFDWWVNQPGGAATLGRVTNVGVWQNMGGSWNVLSSASLKQDIAPWRPENALEAIKHLNPVKFRYKPGTPFAPRDAPSAEVLGLIAEDVAPDFPEIVGTTTVRMQDDDVEVDTLAPGLLVYPLILAVQQLAEMVEDIQQRLE